VRRRPLRGNIVEATEDLIARHNPEWNLGGGTGVYPEWFRDLGNAGFVRLISRTYEEQERYTHEGWRGRIRASAGIGGSLDPARIDEFDRELAKLLDSRFPEPVSIPHRVFLLCASSPDIVLPAS